MISAAKEHAVPPALHDSRLASIPVTHVTGYQHAMPPALEMQCSPQVPEGQLLSGDVSHRIRIAPDSKSRGDDMFPSRTAGSAIASRNVMRVSGRTLTAIAAALLLFVLLPFLWLRMSKPSVDGIRTTTTSTSTDSSYSSTPGNPPSQTVTNVHGTTGTAAAPPSVAPQAVLAGAVNQNLIIPVAGITADKLIDTYTQARSNGRVHDAIDIMAPHNSQVIAAASGTIVRLFHSKLGGTTLYELSPDGHTVYYYAHLDRYADGLVQGKDVAQGELIGYVGDTGDAGPGNYHLHFAIWRIQDPKKFWDGENINPYPILRQVK